MANIFLVEAKRISKHTQILKKNIVTKIKENQIRTRTKPNDKTKNLETKRPITLNLNG